MQSFLKKHFTAVLAKGSLLKSALGNKLNWSIGGVKKSQSK